LTCSEWKTATINEHVIKIIKFWNKLFHIAHALSAALPQLAHVMKQTIRNIKMAALKLDLENLSHTVQFDPKIEWRNNVHEERHICDKQS
jgi:hypothetical protein